MHVLCNSILRISCLSICIHPMFCDLQILQLNDNYKCLQTGPAPPNSTVQPASGLITGNERNHEQVHRSKRQPLALELNNLDARW